MSNENELESRDVVDIFAARRQHQSVTVILLLKDSLAT